MFLVDDTGARRFLTLAIKQCKPIDLDIQQIWAEVWQLYLNSNRWWCDTELENLLAESHKEHSEANAVSELIESVFNTSEPVKRLDIDLRFEHLSTTEILMQCGFNPPSKEQLRQARAFLDSNGFKEVRSTTKKRGFWITREVSTKVLKLMSMSMEESWEKFRNEPI